MNITIFGAGAFGTALGHILKSNNHTVTYYDPAKNPQLNNKQTVPDIFLLAVPSEHLESALETLEKVYKNQPLILATKGILDLKPLEKYKHNLSALSGPAFAAELNAKKPTTLTATSELIKNLLTTDWLTIELTSDLLGLFACGALKNVYAIGSGLLNLKPDTPAFAAYIETAHAELKSLLPDLGGKSATADLACGLGDLILTCGDPQSRNYQFGQNLAKTPTHEPSQTTEGLTTLKNLPKTLEKPPLLAKIANVVLNHAPTCTLSC
jgi:glycerol-3-phosphate dehydrogenase (NAD(P)+)